MKTIRLGNTEFEGENTIYLFDGDRTVLVDTGTGTEQARQGLEAGLADHDLSFADIDDVFLTHYHGDHAGQAGAIHEAGGATIRAHGEDAALIRGDPHAWNALYDQQASLFEAWGMPDEEAETLLSHMGGFDDLYSGSFEIAEFADGDQFDIGETTLEVLHSPGHTAGLSSFVMTDRNEVLSGDALLPVYTPNVGGADVRVERPLAKYMRTLQRFIDRDFDRAWPGHRDVIDEPTERARYIQHHHRERALRVVRVLAERGRADAWTVSADLFGDLEGIHVLHGPGEASAHLDHLVDRGDVERDGTEYTLTADAEERLATFEGDTWPLGVVGD